MNNVSFSENELNIARAWLERKSNSEIALELGKSEPYVSQTLRRIKDKIYTLKNSISLLQELRIIEPVSPIKIIEGRKALVPNRNTDEKSLLRRQTALENQVRLITENLGIQVPGSEEINSFNRGAGSSQPSRDLRNMPRGADRISRPYLTNGVG